MFAVAYVTLKAWTPHILGH